MIVSTARGDIGVLDHGAGPPVVLLHPLALSAEVWRPLLEATPGLRFVAIDAPGHGETPWDGRPFTVQDMAADAVAVLDALGLDRVGLVGLSMGGSTAVVLAGGHPHLIASQVLIDTTACYGDNRLAEWEARASRATGSARADQIPFQVDRWFSPATVEREPETVRRVADLFLRTGSEAHAAACRALGALDARELLPAITAPTAVLVGSEDYATPPEMAAELHAGIAGSRLRVLEGARHLSVLDDPRSWRLATDHLRTTLEGGAPA
ncbi:alpha/beta fold hydrolase [Streptomyces sp. SBT349]|uniref:alpha/beta fold hydrolase n=1 Tax=Streptomyces sp. SBT349 TaxID=1580539 RepID=UPI00066BE547|nr:alpha/beta hydrolase [Streptomyces sp. SBT349]